MIRKYKIEIIVAGMIVLAVVAAIAGTVLLMMVPEANDRLWLEKLLLTKAGALGAFWLFYKILSIFKI